MNMALRENEQFADEIVTAVKMAEHFWCHGYS